MLQERKNDSNVTQMVELLTSIWEEVAGSNFDRDTKKS
jgi:hypothetical protein